MSKKVSEIINTQIERIAKLELQQIKLLRFVKNAKEYFDRYDTSIWTEGKEQHPISKKAGKIIKDIEKE